MKNDMVVRATASVVNSTPRKLNLVAGLIRNRSVAFANIQLRFCTKKAAVIMSKVLNSAVANAQYNCGLDVDNLYVKEVLIGKSLTLRRVFPRAMGRANRISKRYSNVTIQLADMSLVEDKN